MVNQSRDSNGAGTIGTVPRCGINKRPRCGGLPKLGGRSITVAALMMLLTLPAHAQFLGYTSPQTVGPITCISAAVAPATSSAVPGAASFIPSLGQTVHYLTYTTSGTITTMSIQLDGSFNNTTFFRVSETASSPGSGAVSANVYYPFIRCNLTGITGGGSVTATYTGTSVSAGPPAGIFNSSGVFSKTLATGAPANTTALYDVQLPAGNTGGYLWFKQSATYTIGTLLISAGPDTDHMAVILSATAVLSLGGTGPVSIIVPGFAANVARVQYGTGGATAVTYDLSYSFSSGSPTTSNVFSPTGEAEFNCNNRANIAVSASGNTQIIAAPSGVQAIRICHISISFQAMVDISFTQGTGVNCATNNFALTGTYEDVLTFAPGLGAEAALRVTGGSAFCINLGTAVTGGGVIIYAQF